MMISVIIPFYNESERLPLTLSEIDVFCKKNPRMISEVICVDDGSTDNGKGAERALSFSKKIPLRIIRLARNAGKWAAIHEGFANAKTDAVLILDADGSAAIDEFGKIDFLKNAMETKSAIFGSRFMKESVVEGKSFLRQIVSWGYRWYSGILYFYAKGELDVDDLQCPFKLIFMSKIKSELVSNRFAGDMELALAYDGPIWNRPIVFVHKAGSKIKPATIWQMFVETFKIARRYRRLKIGDRDL